MGKSFTVLDEIKVSLLIEDIIKNVKPFSSDLDNFFDGKNTYPKLNFLQEYGHLAINQIFTKWSDNYNDGWVYIIMCERVTNISPPIGILGKYDDLRKFYFDWYKIYNRKRKIKNILNDKH